MKKYTTFHDFYPYYLTEHQNRISRTLHFIGTGIVIALFVVFLLTFNWQYFALMPVAGYGFAWAGHAFLNATNQQPLPTHYTVWAAIL
jgi:hypothetical protein